MCEILKMKKLAAHHGNRIKIWISGSLSVVGGACSARESEKPAIHGLSWKLSAIALGNTQMIFGFAKHGVSRMLYPAILHVP